jgi:hypothetical protein
MIRQFFLICFTAVLGATTAARAHSVWIEPKDGQLVIRFAEPGSELETSPGYLDSLSAPVAFIVVTNATAAIEAPKKSDHFLLSGGVVTNVACVETTFTVRGGRKPIFYARWQPGGRGAATPLLTLDLVPTGKPGEVRAYFRGQPLGGINATLRTPDEKEQELTADAEGLIHFTTEKPGQYLLTIAHHREPLAGFHQGIAYKETSHNCSLTWQQTR